MGKSEELRRLIVRLLEKIEDESLLGLIYACVNRSFVRGRSLPSAPMDVDNCGIKLERAKRRISEARGNN